MELIGAIRQVDGALEISVYCQPRSARTSIAGFHGKALKVKVRAPAMQGRANEELTVLLARVLKIPKRSLKLTSGGRSRFKRVRAEGIDVAEAVSRLQSHLTL